MEWFCFHAQILTLLTTSRAVILRRIITSISFAAMLMRHYESCPSLLCHCWKGSDLNPTQWRFKLPLIEEHRWIESRWKVCRSTAWKYFEISTKLCSLFFNRVVVRTVHILTVLGLTPSCFIYFGVILALLPPMTVFAHQPINATVFVFSHFLRIVIPFLTLCVFIWVLIWLSSIVLPVMRIHTQLSCMVFFVHRTPRSLEMEHVEVRIFFVFVYEINRDFSFRMSKRTIVAVFAQPTFVRIATTEFCFVFLWMIKFFHCIMGESAPVSVSAQFLFLYVLALFGPVGAQFASAILLFVVVHDTLLQIMIFRFFRALLSLEHHQVEEHGLTFDQFAGWLTCHRSGTGVKWFQSWLRFYIQIQPSLFLPGATSSASIAILWCIDVCTCYRYLVLPLCQFLLFLIALFLVVWTTTYRVTMFGHILFFVFGFLGLFTFLACTCFLSCSELHDDSLFLFPVEIRAIPSLTRVRLFLMSGANQGFESKWMEHDFILSVCETTLVTFLTWSSLCNSDLLCFRWLFHRGSARDWHIQELTHLVKDWSAEVLSVMALPAGGTRAAIRLYVDTILS